MDWNGAGAGAAYKKFVLLSTRRVWIEIAIISRIITSYNVTLHTESMDWNLCCYDFVIVITSYSPHGEYGLKSAPLPVSQKAHALLSTRRVWIEINKVYKIAYSDVVTLHTESMDWNKGWSCYSNISVLRVTLHTESMDWNL